MRATFVFDSFDSAGGGRLSSYCITLATVRCKQSSAKSVTKHLPEKVGTVNGSCGIAGTWAGEFAVCTGDDAAVSDDCCNVARSALASEPVGCAETAGRRRVGSRRPACPENTVHVLNMRENTYWHPTSCPDVPRTPVDIETTSHDDVLT
jgi:hypothetical protein